MAAHLRLQGTLALVTGGGSGIGRAICTRFAREGALVAIADCDEAGASKTLQGLQAGDHEALRVDVGCAKSVAHLVDRIQARFSRPASVCVNCAGITMDEFLLKQTEEAFDTVLRVNLKGTFLVTQAVARALVAAGISQGSIINLGSVVGKVGNLGQVNYAASKAGVEALSKTAAKELARYGIRCNTVLPGFIRSPMTEKVPQKVLDKFAAMVPLGRLGEPEDVAEVCTFLASDESCYITGASLEVTGGLFI
ncbi:(3R)-3-hydroxyacyl-CoA dehydrogenase isoform X2 [Rhineura floridana]|uniref:(3R)-3-hydroxyacyl-CoA dehydrogenase isoform X2 n=1 Tax=Rhineura floridana TaxID=261503 RepID=UPI002AC84CEF|nr:(3R)-3-hydroxyacyl-CoA dehydrogenase isoform X2 [Rhineura floridana]